MGGHFNKKVPSLNIASFPSAYIDLTIYFRIRGDGGFLKTIIVLCDWNWSVKWDPDSSLTSAMEGHSWGPFTLLFFSLHRGAVGERGNSRIYAALSFWTKVWDIKLRTYFVFYCPLFASATCQFNYSEAPLLRILAD